MHRLQNEPKVPLICKYINFICIIFKCFMQDAIYALYMQYMHCICHICTGSTAHFADDEQQLDQNCTDIRGSCILLLSIYASRELLGSEGSSWHRGAQAVLRGHPSRSGGHVTAAAAFTGTCKMCGNCALCGHLQRARRWGRLEWRLLE